MNKPERIFIGIKFPEHYLDAISGLFADNADKRLKNCRWVAKESMHMTLTFIGEVPTEKRIRVQNALKSVRFNSFNLKIKNQIVTFPPNAKKNIRVIHMPIFSAETLTAEESELKGISPLQLSMELNQLKNSIDSSIENSAMIELNEEEEDAEEGKKPANPQPEKKQKEKKKKEIFHPHLTLSRVKQYSKVQEILEWMNDSNNLLQDPNQPSYSIWNEMNFPVTSFILFRSTLTPKGSIYEIIEEYLADNVALSADNKVGSDEIASSSTVFQKIDEQLKEK